MIEIFHQHSQCYEQSFSRVERSEIYKSRSTSSLQILLCVSRYGKRRTDVLDVFRMSLFIKPLRTRHLRRKSDH